MFAGIQREGLLTLPHNPQGVVQCSCGLSCGLELFQVVALSKLDLEGIVAKPKHSPYEREPARTSWYKIKNRSYSQMVGRHELFERERHLEPVPGWHSCTLVCPESAYQL